MDQENLEKLRILIYHQAQILAVAAEIEGMKAANTERLEKGHTIAYGDESFFSKADEIKLWAHDMTEEFRRKL
jgi:hypothetical protein